MPKFTVSVDTGSAAFADNLGAELGTMLRRLADEVDDGHRNTYAGGPLRDSNGNKVGKWSLENPHER